MDVFVLREEPTDGPIQDYVSRWEVEKLIELRIKTSVNVATTRPVTVNEEESIEEVFTEVYIEEKEIVKTPISNIWQGSLI